MDSIAPEVGGLNVEVREICQIVGEGNTVSQKADAGASYRSNEPVLLNKHQVSDPISTIDNLRLIAGPESLDRRRSPELPCISY
jgi:hypothetical protein